MNRNVSRLCSEGRDLSEIVNKKANETLNYCDFQWNISHPISPGCHPQIDDDLKALQMSAVCRKINSSARKLVIYVVLHNFMLMKYFIELGEVE